MYHREAGKGISAFPHLSAPSGFGLFLQLKGLAVGALVHGGVLLVGAHMDLLQTTERCVGTVVRALLYATLDGRVSSAILHFSSLLIVDDLILPHRGPAIRKIEMFSKGKKKKKQFL